MNLLTLLDMAAAGHGDRLLLGTSARGLTGEQLAERSRRGARFLTAAGAQTVVYIGENGLAVPLARLRPRQGRFARVWVAVVIYFLYQNLITVGKVWISRGTVPEVVGLWWTHAALVLLALTVIMGPTIATRIRYRVRGL